MAVWKLARWEPRLLYLAAQLRPLLYLRPLLPFAPSLAEAGQAMLAHLPTDVTAHLQALVETLSTQSSGDLHRDVSAGLSDRSRTLPPFAGNKRSAASNQLDSGLPSAERLPPDR